MADLLMSFPKWQWLATAAAFLFFAGLEGLLPFRSAGGGRLGRWFANLGLMVIGVGVAMVASPLILASAGWIQQATGFPGLVSLGLPPWLLVVVSFLLIDLIAYLQHAVFHLLPWLWRIHRVHHSDPVLDASTGVRHHPLEALIGSFVQLTLLVVMGLPLLVILAYIVITTVWQYFSHANVRLPETADRLIRLVLVTPGMHRVHHSVRMDEGNSNFGMVLSIWDRLFGTYRWRGLSEQSDMVLGIEGQTARQGLLSLLIFRDRD